MAFLENIITILDPKLGRLNSFIIIRILSVPENLNALITNV